MVVGFMGVEYMVIYVSVVAVGGLAKPANLLKTGSLQTLVGY